MNKIKIIIVCLLVPVLVLMAAAFMKFRSKEQFQQKTLLAQEIRKVLDRLMFDLREARENTIQDVPADGEWHHRFAFDRSGQGALEYTINEGHLYRMNQGEKLLIADHIADLRMRRQKSSPDVLEVQIEAQNDVTLISNLKIRIRQQ